ncbi:uncharacterized protein BKA55DRAFT_548628 [Fusarium redolens]|uniref:Uncharacterized protein n=1 Tax=Fusarium redolens TaxID=48865 RepID=A0A9P9R893_FUSRE|nr:uncharacterized protein BKA55DRAFT_548628 [Fusarium redolens]KAH7269452.1 hypothetical protein BKA55DRAFT_548628 [Fusarium redolens]
MINAVTCLREPNVLCAAARICIVVIMVVIFDHTFATVVSMEVFIVRGLRCCILSLQSCLGCQRRNLSWRTIWANSGSSYNRIERSYKVERRK